MPHGPEHSSSLEESFLIAFSEIERLLKARLHLSLSNSKPASRLIAEYADANPYWAEEGKDLECFRQIRNFLTHERSEEHGFPVRVTAQSQARLMKIKAALEASVPVAKNYRKKVISVESETSLAEVLRLAYKYQFSQFPVVSGGNFRGLVTENEITRWLGRQVGRGVMEVNLCGVLMKTVLREKEPDRRGIPIFRFRSLDAPEVEVMALFLRHPMLEVVLLTRSGDKSTAIEGIVTQWDAARYPTG